MSDYNHPGLMYSSIIVVILVIVSVAYYDFASGEAKEQACENIGYEDHDRFNGFDVCFIDGKLDLVNLNCNGFFNVHCDANLIKFGTFVTVGGGT